MMADAPITPRKLHRESALKTLTPTDLNSSDRRNRRSSSKDIIKTMSTKKKRSVETPTKSLKYDSNLPVVERIDAHKYNIQFPVGPMGLILEPVLISHNPERRLGCRVKGFHFSSEYKQATKAILLREITIGDVINSVDGNDVYLAPFDYVFDLLKKRVDDIRKVGFKVISMGDDVDDKRTRRNSMQSSTAVTSPSSDTHGMVKTTPTYTMSSPDAERMKSPQDHRESNMSALTGLDDLSVLHADTIRSLFPVRFEELSHLLHSLGANIGSGLVSLEGKTERALGETAKQIPLYSRQDMDAANSKTSLLLRELSETCLRLGRAEEMHIAAQRELAELRSSERREQERVAKLNAQVSSLTSRVEGMGMELGAERGDRDAWVARAQTAEEEAERCRMELDDVLQASREELSRCHAELEEARRSRQKLEEEHASRRTALEDRVRWAEKALEDAKLTAEREEEAVSREVEQLQCEQDRMRREMDELVRKMKADRGLLERERDLAVAEVEVLKDLAGSERQTIDSEKMRLKEAISGQQRQHMERLLEKEEENHQIRSECNDLKDKLTRAMSQQKHDADTITSLRNKLSRAEDRETDALSAVRRLEEEIDGRSVLLERQSQELKEVKDDLGKAQSREIRLKEEIEGAQRSLQNMKSTTESTEQLLTTLRAELMESQRTVVSRESEVAELKRHLVVVKEEFSNSTQHSTDQLARMRTRAEKRESELLAALSSSETTMSKLKQDVDKRCCEAEEEIERLQARCDSMSAEIKQYKADKSLISDELREKESELAVCKQERDALQNKLNAETSRWESDRESLSSLQRYTDLKEKELMALKEAVVEAESRAKSAETQVSLVQNDTQHYKNIAHSVERSVGLLQAECDASNAKIGALTQAMHDKDVLIKRLRGCLTTIKDRTFHELAALREDCKTLSEIVCVVPEKSLQKDIFTEADRLKLESMESSPCKNCTVLNSELFQARAALEKAQQEVSTESYRRNLLDQDNTTLKADLIATRAEFERMKCEYADVTQMHKVELMKVAEESEKKFAVLWQDEKARTARMYEDKIKGILRSVATVHTDDEEGIESTHTVAPSPCSKAFTPSPPLISESDQSHSSDWHVKYGKELEQIHSMHSLISHLKCGSVEKDVGSDDPVMNFSPTHLQSELGDSDSALANLQRVVEDSHLQLTTKQEELIKMTRMLHELQLKCNGLTEQLSESEEQSELKLKQLSESYQADMLKLQSANSDLSASVARHEETMARINENHKSEVASLQTDIDRLRQLLAEQKTSMSSVQHNVETQFNELKSECERLKKEVAHSEERYDACVESYERRVLDLNLQISNIRNEATGNENAYSQNISHYRRQLQEYDTQRISLRNEICEMEDKFRKCEEESHAKILELRAENTALSDALSNIEKTNDQTNKKMLEAKSQCFELQNAVVEAEHLLKTCKERYDLQFEELKIERDHYQSLSVSAEDSLNANMEKHTTEIRDLSEQLQQVTQQFEKQQKELSNLRVERDKLTVSLTDSEKELTDSIKALSRMEMKYSKVLQQFSSLSEEADSLKSAISVRSEIVKCDSKDVSTITSDVWSGECSQCVSWEEKYSTLLSEKEAILKSNESSSFQVAATSASVAAKEASEDIVGPLLGQLQTVIQEAQSRETEWARARESLRSAIEEWRGKASAAMSRVVALETQLLEISNERSSLKEQCSQLRISISRKDKELKKLESIVDNLAEEATKTTHTSDYEPQAQENLKSQLGDCSSTSEFSVTEQHVSSAYSLQSSIESLHSQCSWNQSSSCGSWPGDTSGADDLISSSLVKQLSAAQDKIKSLTEMVFESQAREEQLRLQHSHSGYHFSQPSKKCKYQSLLVWKTVAKFALNAWRVQKTRYRGSERSVVPANSESKSDTEVYVEHFTPDEMAYIRCLASGTSPSKVSIGPIFAINDIPSDMKFQGKRTELGDYTPEIGSDGISADDMSAASSVVACGHDEGSCSWYVSSSDAEQDSSCLTDYSLSPNRG